MIVLVVIFLLCFVGGILAIVFRTQVRNICKLLATYVNDAILGILVFHLLIHI